MFVRRQTLGYRGVGAGVGVAATATRTSRHRNAAPPSPDAPPTGRPRTRWTSSAHSAVVGRPAPVRPAVETAPGSRVDSEPTSRFVRQLVGLVHSRDEPVGRPAGAGRLQPMSPLAGGVFVVAVAVGTIEQSPGPSRGGSRCTKQYGGTCRKQWMRGDRSPGQRGVRPRSRRSGRIAKTRVSMKRRQP